MSGVVRNVEFPIPLSASIEDVSNEILFAVAKVEGVLSTPPPVVTPLLVKMDQIVLRLRFWIDSFPQGDAITGLVIDKCFTRLQEKNLLMRSEGQSTQVIGTSGTKDSEATENQKALEEVKASENPKTTKDPKAMQDAKRQAPGSAKTDMVPVKEPD